MSRRDFKILGWRRVLNGHVPVYEVDFEFRLSNDQMSGKLTHTLAKPQDACAILAYHVRRRQFILVEQCRPATSHGQPNEGFLTELPAGRIRENEDRRQCARREFCEETDYLIGDPAEEDCARQLDRFEHIATIYSSVGMTTERVFIYYIELGDTDDENRRKRKAFLKAQADEPRPYRADPPEPTPIEDVEVKEVPLEEFLEGLDAGRYHDAKLIAAAHWFRTKASQRVAIPPPRNAAVYEFAADRPDARARPGDSSGLTRQIVVVPGNILEVGQYLDPPPDIWVSSENTDMQMDRFFGKSISATIRRTGALQFGGTIYRDTIADELRAKLHGSHFVHAGTVVVTGSGDLANPPYGVKKIFHAAAVQGVPGKDYIADPAISALCVKNALDKAAHLNEWDYGWSWLKRYVPWRKTYSSILMPLFGTGQGGKPPSVIANAMVEAIVTFLRANPDKTLRQVCLLGSTSGSYDAITTALQPYVEDGTLVKSDSSKMSHGKPDAVSS